MAHNVGSFSPKHVAEEVTYALDFADLLASGATLATAADWTATVVEGEDANPSAIISGSAAIDGTKSAQTITGGVEGVTYRLLGSVTDSNGQTLELEGYLTIARAREPLHRQRLLTDKFTGVEDGRWLETGRRTNWTLQLDIRHLSSGGDVTVAVEVSPDAQDDTAVEVHDFGAVSATGRTKVTSFSVRAITERDLYIRGKVKAVTGTAWLELAAWAEWFRASDAEDTHLLSQGLRDWNDGLNRTVEQAEADVLRRILDMDTMGRLEARTNEVGFGDTLKRAIAAQANHIYRREQLARSSEPTAQVTLRSLQEISPTAAQLLRPFRWEKARVWRGR